MARILRGLKGLSALAGRGGGVVVPCPALPCLALPCLACLSSCLPFLPWGIFRPQTGTFLVSGVGLVGLVGFVGLWGFSALLFLPPACGVHLQREKSRFCPCLLLCLVCLSLCRFILGRDKRKTALCVGRFSLGGGVWLLPVLVSEHCKRCGAFAKYPYFFYCVVGFNPSGGWACNIIQIASICGLC